MANANPSNIRNYLDGIIANRNTIRAKLVELGLNESTANLSALATTIEGLANNGAVSVSVKEGETYTIPAGYHNGSGTVSGVAGGGNYTLQSKVVTPTKKQQPITSDEGYYGLDSVTVEAIPEAYQDVSAVTATAGDVLVGKVYVAADGTVITGTMVNNGAVSKTLDVTTITYTIPAGYHDGNGTISIALETKTVTPTKSAQTITPTSGKVLSEVVVEAIPDEFTTTDDATVTAEDILEGEFAYGTDPDSGLPVKIEGTMPNNGNVGTIDLNIANAGYRIPAGYHDGQGLVKVTSESMTATPTEESQVIKSSKGQYLDQVTVNAIPLKYANLENDTVKAEHILEGETAHGYNTETGKAVTLTGTMKNNGAINETIDGLTVGSYTIPAGYTSGGTVSLTDDIETLLASI